MKSSFDIASLLRIGPAKNKTQIIRKTLDETMDGIEEYKLAGKIAKNVREYGFSLLKENASMYGIVSSIEEKIGLLGAKIAFPVNLSVNEFAAHDTAEKDDTRILKKGDVVKLDIGVHVNGYIADTAVTKEIKTSKHSKLIESSRKAFDNVAKKIVPGITFGEIGEIIENTIRSYGFKPIANLSGHGLARYDLHHEITIPNYNNNSQHKLRRGEAIAIEPFASTGDGHVKNYGAPKIFRLAGNSRICREFIEKARKFNNLPFSKAWLEKDDLFCLKMLSANKTLEPYIPLKDNGIVSQHEHTILVLEKPIITTK